MARSGRRRRPGAAARIPVPRDQQRRRSDGRRFPMPKAMDGMAAFPLRMATCCWFATKRTARPASAASPSGRQHIDECRHPEPSTGYALRSARVRVRRFAAGGTTTLEVEPHGKRRVVTALESRRHRAQLRGWFDTVGQLDLVPRRRSRAAPRPVRPESRLQLRGPDRHRSWYAVRRSLSTPRALRSRGGGRGSGDRDRLRDRGSGRRLRLLSVRAVDWPRQPGISPRHRRAADAEGRGCMPIRNSDQSDRRCVRCPSSG